jgi:hypothetical protein
MDRVERPAEDAQSLRQKTSGLDFGLRITDCGLHHEDARSIPSSFRIMKSFDTLTMLRTVEPSAFRIIFSPVRCPAR